MTEGGADECLRRGRVTGEAQIDPDGRAPLRIRLKKLFGEREPSLIVLLRYARLAGVSMDVLADDGLDLPARLPAKPKYRT